MIVTPFRADRFEALSYVTRQGIIKSVGVDNQLLVVVVRRWTNGEYGAIAITPTDQGAKPIRFVNQESFITPLRCDVQHKAFRHNVCLGRNRKLMEWFHVTFGRQVGDMQ